MLLKVIVNKLRKRKYW